MKRAVLRYADQYELRYNRSLELVFGTRRRFSGSFVTPHMLFQRPRVEGLLARIQARFSASGGRPSCARWIGRS